MNKAKNAKGLVDELKGVKIWTASLMLSGQHITRNVYRTRLIISHLKLRPQFPVTYDINKAAYYD